MSTTPAVIPFTAAHRSYVKTLYRRALIDSLAWYVRRDIWRTKAIEIRVLFEENRNIRDPRAVATMLAKVEKDLNRLRHPDRIIPAQAPGGTKWERNIHPKMFTAADSNVAADSHSY